MLELIIERCVRFFSVRQLHSTNWVLPWFCMGDNGILGARYMDGNDRWQPSTTQRLLCTEPGFVFWDWSQFEHSSTCIRLHHVVKLCICLNKLIEIARAERGNYINITSRLNFAFVTSRLEQPRSIYPYLEHLSIISDRHSNIFRM